MKTTLKLNSPKTILLGVSLLLSLTFFCNKTFAQRDAGGSTGGFVTQPCPISFKRNNGNGFGVCGGDAQIRVTFSELPTVAPKLIEILYVNKSTGEETNITSVMLPVEGDFISKTHPYVSYCLNGSLPPQNNGNPQANIPPAIKLVLVFKYSTGQICRTDIEE